MTRLLQVEEPNKKGHVRSLVLAPTKELATQIYEVLKGLLGFHAASAAMLDAAATADDGLSDSEGEEVVAKPVIPPGPYLIPQLLIGGRQKLGEDLATFSTLNPNILIGTPRRVLEVLQSPKVVLRRHWFDLLILDEADRLLDPNFQPDLQKILELVPKERRTGLFSASVSEAVDELVRVGMRYPFKISAKVRSKTGALDKRTPESLKLCHVVTKPSRKLPVLRRILDDTKAMKTIIYVSTRAGVDYWSHVLPTVLGVSVFPLHGDHKTAIRSKNLQRFRDATSSAALLTTDVLARGIDIPDIDMVVQLDAPSQPKDFIHRCGRSGRAGKRGMAITFINEGGEEDYIKYLDLQGTKLEAYPDVASISDEDVVRTTAQIRVVMMQKREMHDRSQKAFVSWVQAYTKQLPADIFNIRKLDWAELGRAWGLLQWPKMPELKKHFPAAASDRTAGLDLPAELQLDALAYADSVREAQRQTILQSIGRGERPPLPARFAGAAAELRRRTQKAWSGQKEAKHVREERRERKDVRRQAERSGKMSESERADQMVLDDLVEQVRQQHANTVDEGEEEFEGFG